MNLTKLLKQRLKQHSETIAKELMELLKEPYLLSSFFIQIHSERHIEQLHKYSVTRFSEQDPNKLPRSLVLATSLFIVMCVN